MIENFKNSQNFEYECSIKKLIGDNKVDEFSVFLIKAVIHTYRHFFPNWHVK